MTCLIRHLPLLILLATACYAAPAAERIYLSGKGPTDAVEWDFYCSDGRRSGEWTTIPVPSNWEQHGFGTYNYGYDAPDEKGAETGTYRTTFTAPEAWKDKHVRIVFEGAMTETSIKVNGQTVGAPNLGGFQVFRYILDDEVLKYGEENTLEVLVKKKPGNDSLDRAERSADYWVFGGIYRPVYLEVQSRAFVHRVAIDARADGDLRIDVFPQVHHTARNWLKPEVHVDGVVARIQTPDGVDVGEPMTAPVYAAAARIRLNTQVADPELWSPEFPNLYQVKVNLILNGEIVSEYIERFGFRSIELRPEDGLYLNGKKIRVRGVNRNVFHPEHGRAVDSERIWSDARSIKAMNANLVRSHLPPTLEFMQASAELGLMVVTELATWQKPYIDTPIAREIAYNLVATYQNFPSVIFWANGNEGGFNREIDEVFRLYDLQERPIIHPWSYFEGLDTYHYPRWENFTAKLSGPNLYLPTEFLHGLYDGGQGAGLEDYWGAIRNSPTGAGGVLWCWADAAIQRTDLNGELDTHGNKSADGIVGPYGEREASYYTVREIWSPVQIPLETLAGGFDGKLPVENRFYDTSLDACTFEWQLLDVSDPSESTDSKVIATGHIAGPAVQPGGSGHLVLPLPDNWRESDVLQLSATSPAGVELMRWSWPTGKAQRLSAVAGNRLRTDDRGDRVVVTQGETDWVFSSRTGHLLSSSVGGKDSGLGRGPILYASTIDGALEFDGDWSATVTESGGKVSIAAKNSADGSNFEWTVKPDGTLELDYSFAEISEELDYCAVGMELDNGVVASKRWLGKGPYRVWGNRLPGPIYGLWENAYNDMLPGDTWGEPSFKGIFDQVDWMELALESGSALLVHTIPGTALGVLRPRNTDGARNDWDGKSPVHAQWRYPEGGGLHVFHKLPGVGTKFHNPEELSPQGEPARIDGPIEGSLVLRLR